MFGCKQALGTGCPWEGWSHHLWKHSEKKAELELHNMIEWPWWYLVKAGLDHGGLFQP